MTDAQRLWKTIRTAMQCGKEAYANERTSMNSDDSTECAIAYGFEKWRDIPGDVQSIIAEAWREGYSIEKRYYI